MIYVCKTCGYVYDEEVRGVKFEDLPDDWICPICKDSKSSFVLKGESTSRSVENKPADKKGIIEVENLKDLLRKSDEIEDQMSVIHQIALSGKSVSTAMKSQIPMNISWNEILFKGGQLAVRPLEISDPVSTQVVIGQNAERPMILETPIIISHMSFGALSKEAKTALAKGSAAVKGAMCSGEGGILPESLREAYKYIFEYVPNKYSVTDENLQNVDAVEIKFGQSAKPGMGGHLPAEKVTAEIAKIRDKIVAEDILSPSAFSDILGEEDLKNTVDSLRERSGGKPIGIKLAAGHIEADLEYALKANPDFITIDGRAGGTGSSPKYLKDSASIPTIYALARARKYLDKVGARGVSLIITGGLRTSSDFAKALAMGADAVAIASAAMMAIGCQQYRVCNNGMCPMGIATQDPDLRKRFNVDKSAKALENFLKVSNEEIKNFARVCGKNDIKLLNTNDIFTLNSDIAKYTDIKHAGEAE